MPTYEHTHPSITSAVPIGCNAEIKSALVDYITSCCLLGMANTLPNILIATKLWHEGYSAECTVRFFGLGQALAEAPPTITRRSISLSKDDFTQRIMALAATGNLTLDRLAEDYVIFSHNGRQVGIILTVNKVQDRVWFDYDS